MRMLKKATTIAVAVIAMAGGRAADGGMIGINVLLNQPPSDAILADLGTHGRILDVLREINAVMIRSQASELAAIQALPYVTGANPDRQRKGGETESSRYEEELTLPDFSDGASLWNLDAINVTDFGAGRTVGYDGEGVYVAMIDFGLLCQWRNYFPATRIDTIHARGFGGGGGNVGTVSTQPNGWEHSTQGAGNKLTSIILGIGYQGTAPLPQHLNGVAPMATIIPIKIWSNSGIAWSSVAARGILYAAELKVSGALGNSPLVINLSFGAHEADAAEQAAIDYAIAHGVIVVGGVEDRGDAGLRFPGAYPPVISVGNAGWTGQLPINDPTLVEWILRDVPESDAFQYYIDPSSGRALPGQDLDVVAPGSWIPVAGSQNGQVNYTFRSSSRMACPHVSGVVALMLQKNPNLIQAQVESILVSTALPILAGCRDVTFVGVGPGNDPSWDDHGNVFFVQDPVSVCWGANATGAGLVQADAALVATPMP